MSKMFDHLQPASQPLTEVGLVRLWRITGYLSPAFSLPLSGVVAAELNQQGRPFEAVASLGAGIALSAMSLAAANRQARKLEALDEARR